MAQQIELIEEIVEDELKQPGNNNNDEGTARPSSDKYSEYVFEFQSLDSLIITVKSKKSKRLFLGKFSKQQLASMKLTQSIKEIISMIKMAKNGIKQNINCQFKIAFSAADETADVNQMKNIYFKGAALYLVVSINEAWLSCDYLFKLEEQERDELDIQSDIIEDLREEIAALKVEISKPKINGNPTVVFKCNTPAQTVPWNVVHIASRLEGMATTQDNNGSIVIGIAGRYRLSVRFGLNNDWGSTLTHDLKLNGTTIGYGRTYHSHSNTFDEIRNFNQGDKLNYVLNSTVSNDYWDINCNHFILEYLGNE